METTRAEIPPQDARILPSNLVLSVTAGLGIAIYVLLWPLASGDMHDFVVPWLRHILAAGPIGAFAEPFSNYTPPYLYLLTAVAPLTGLVGALSTIKILSVAATFFLAWSVYRLLATLEVPNPVRWAALVPALPTVALNTALLGQCDVIWSAACILAVAAAIDGKPKSVLAWAGIAFAFKAQAAFIAPFVLLYLLWARVPLRLWPIAALSCAGMMLPAWLAGWPAADIATVYFRQAEWTDGLSLNAPNLWALAQAAAPLDPRGFGRLGMLATLIAIYFYVARLLPRLSRERLLEAALLSALLVPGILPRMHERYFFLADILAFALAVSVRGRDTLLIAVTVQLGSLLALLAYVMAAEQDAMAGGVAMMAATAALCLRFASARAPIDSRRALVEPA
jgi:Gpi18-like mannosyltransferase